MVQMVKDGKNGNERPLLRYYIKNWVFHYI